MKWSTASPNTCTVDDERGKGQGDEVVRLHDDLEWDNGDPMRPVLCHNRTPVASFECMLPDSPRMVAKLELLDGHRGVDITVQPDTIVHLLRRLAASRNRNVDAWLSAVRRQLLSSAQEWGIADTSPSDTWPSDTSLGALIASLGFPIVRMARARGVMPPPYIPRWAEPALTQTDTRAAARAVFGSRTNRRVARTLPASLLGDTDPLATPEHGRAMVLMPLALAMALPEASSGDLISNVLSAPVADHAPHHWPSVDQLEVVRRGFELIGVDAAQRFAVEALATLNGPERLFALMIHIPRLYSSHLGPLPRRLNDLGEAVTDFVHQAIEAAPQRVAAYDAGGVIELPVRPRYAPGRVAPVGHVEDFEYPDEVMRIHGATSGAHSLWLPSTRDELRAWGVQLHNCMADYSEHVACNRSVIFGMRRNGRLVAGVELTRDLRQVRQFVRDDNLRPWRAERDALRDIFRRLGVAGG